MPDIFLINGPPMCGKDTLAERLIHKYNGQLFKFADPIKRTVTQVYHAGDRAEFDHYDCNPDLKGTPQDVYFGKSCRDVQIAVSESWLKPYHNDPGIFGHLLVKSIEQNAEPNKPIFVSDSGFRREAEVLVDVYGAERVVLFRIEREGFTFKGANDSRDYIYLKDLGVGEFDIYNPQDNLNAFFTSADRIMEYFYPQDHNAALS